MAKAKLKQYKYYSWSDIEKRFGFKSIDDVFEGGIDFMTNGHLINFFVDECTEEELSRMKPDKRRRYNNQKRIFDELGECNIHICW